MSKPFQAHRRQDFIQKLARLAHKGPPQTVLVSTRPLSYQHQPCAGISLSEDDPGTTCAQVAAGASCDPFLQRLKAFNNTQVKIRLINNSVQKI
jgi:hypothetical protein